MKIACRNTHPDADAKCGCHEGACLREDYIGTPSGDFDAKLEAAKANLEKVRQKIEGGRLDRDDMFMEYAQLAARRSTCKRGHVGAVVVLDKRPVSIGYNGSPPGHAHCTEVGCEPVPPVAGMDLHGEELLHRFGCQRTIHAEANALMWAARMGVPTLGAVVYVTHAPCRACARLLAAAGAMRVVYAKDYRADGIDILTESGIEVIKHG